MKPEHIAIKLATSEMIKGCGGLEAAAGFCRVGKSVLGDNQSVNRADSFVAIDVVHDLEPLARDRVGWPHVTRALAAGLGFALVELPTANVDPTDDLSGCAVVHAKESNDVTVKILGLAPRGRLTAQAVRNNDLVREGREAVEAAVKLLAMLEAIEGSEE